jgi:ribonucleoside-triphosphate reductase
MTGIYDNPLTYDIESSELLVRILDEVNATNQEWADRLGIPHSVSTSCVKPSGTVSALCDTASGIHPRHAEFYIRSVRQDNKDPVTTFLKAAGIPNEPDVMKPESTTVFYFPMKSPEKAITRDKVNALDHLALWMKFNKYWAEHQVSITVNLKDNEWMEAGAWVYKNFDDITGISFLPFDGGTYKQAPFQTVTKEQYEEALAKMPTEIDWTLLANYEKEDTTTSAQELACTGGVCEIS